MKIAHFADIHLRPLDRHDEYRQAFQYFFDNAKILQVDAIVLAGDILHEKTQRITPEVIEMVAWLFTELAKVAPTYIILGNHDGNLKNLHRKDAISPIVKALNNPNINLFLKSGTYPISEKISLCAYSPFDEKGWGGVEPDQGKINICLFHGSVQGSTTDMGYELDGEVETSFFNKYDFTFLGDIHKFQFLDKEKRIAYPGSTLQQNFGESIKNHGFLLWNIRDKHDFDVRHVEIENKRPFVTLEWKKESGKDDSQKFSKFLYEANKYPNGSRFRVYSERKIPQHDKKRIEHELKEKKEASLIVYKNEKLGTAIASEETNKQLRRDLRDPSTVFNLFKSFIGEDILNKSQFDLASQIIENYLESLKEDESTTRGRTWVPRRIEFDNIMQYGEGNMINFDSCEGIIGIFAPNMSGKSTTIAAMVYALFGRLDREILQNHYHGMINNRKESCFAKFDFTVSGENYRVHRVTERVEKDGGRYGAKSKIYFYKMTDAWDELEPLHREKPQDTEKAIRKVVGSLEDFKLTALANQRNVEAFMRERVTVRKQHLARFRDLQSLDFLYGKANADWATQKTLLKSLTALDWDSAIFTLQAEKEKTVQNIENYESLLEILRDGLSRVKEDFAKKGDGNTVDQQELDQQELVVENLKEEKRKIELQIEAVTERKIELQSKIDEIVEAKSKIDVDKIREKLAKKNELEKKMSGLKEKLNAAFKVLEQKEKTIKKLDIVPCGDSFPTCRYIKDAHIEKKNIVPQKDLIKEIESDIQKCEILIVDDVDYEKRLKEHSDLEKKEIALIRKISSVSVEALEHKLENVSTKLISNKEKLKEMEINFSDDDSIKELRNKIEKIKVEIKETDNKRILSATRIGKIESEIDNLRSDKIKFEELNEKCKIYEQLAFAFGKKGIPNQILRMDLPAINSEIKEILQDIDEVDSVEFELEEESDKLDIYVESNNTRIPIELCSGAQLVIASIALRVGLMRASNLPKPDMFILDEPFESTDSSRVDSIVRMIDSLKKWFKKVFLITHLESIKGTADTMIEVSVKGQNSYVYHE